MSDLASRSTADVTSTVEQFLDDVNHGLVSATDMHRVSTSVFRALAMKASIRTTLTAGQPSPKLKHQPKAEKQKSGK